LSTLAVILTATVLGACGKTSSTGSGPSQIPTGPGPGGSISDYTAYCAYIGGIVQWNGTNQYCYVQRNYGSSTWYYVGNHTQIPQVILSSPPTLFGPIFPSSFTLNVVALDRVTFKGRLRWSTDWDLFSCDYEHSSPMLASEGTVVYNLGSDNVELTTSMTTAGQLYMGFEQLPSSVECAKIEISKLIVHHCEDSNRQTISCP
jgi:hypothetical protein